MHAHIRADLPTAEVATLSGFVVAATRSLEEAETALARSDERVTWGVGCHPGLVGVQKSFDIAAFERLALLTPIVSEVGLDGGSRVPAKLQESTFESVLHVVAKTPRVMSVHSAQASGRVLDIIQGLPSPGIVLHWWLGDESQTRRALDLGCYFSVNSSTRSLSLISRVPYDRVLPETDHPFGDKRGGRAARPANVLDVERAMSSQREESLEQVRLQMWRNFATLAAQTATSTMFPSFARRQFAAM